MRALVQRVTAASVRVAGEVAGQIDGGLVIFIGIGSHDDVVDARYLAAKIAQMRLFGAGGSGFDRSLLDIGGSALVVSQFTLFASTRKGRRPSFTGAAPPDQARRLIDEFTTALRAQGVAVQSGIFGAHMVVDLRNDGPVTVWLDSAERSSRTAG